MAIPPIFKIKGFHFDPYLTDNQNFERLSYFLNWNDEEYWSNHKKFKEQLSKMKKQKFYYLPFFLKYIENNGFKYDNHKTEEENFQLLVRHMKWNRTVREKNREIFEEQMCEYGINENYDALNGPSIFAFKDIFQYFDYYVENFGLQYHQKENTLNIFDKICRLMDWNDLYERNKHKFNSRQKENKEKWLCDMIKDNKLKVVFDSKRSLSEIFEEIAFELNWNDLKGRKRLELDQFIADEVVRNLRNLKILQDVIVFYELDKDFNDGNIPKSMNKCRKLIKKHLFVNIYDYIIESPKRFYNIKDLKNYSIDNELIYPLSEAKRDYILRTLLKNLI